MVHSEVVLVTVTKGLFSTCLGCGSSSFFDIFIDDPLYLQTQLAGEPPMAPRTLLRNVPRALVASRVMGLAVGGLSLLIGVLGIAKYFFPEVGAHTEGRELLMGLAVVGTMATSFLLALHLSRRQASALTPVSSK
jgi:hypothetical protein